MNVVVAFFCFSSPVVINIYLVYVFFVYSTPCNFRSCLFVLFTHTQAYCVNDWSHSSKHWLELISVAWDLASSLRQILERTHEIQDDKHHLFADYKPESGRPSRARVIAAMSKFGISAKLIRLCGMTLSNSISSVKIGMHLSKPFNTVRGLRQGDPLSCDLFSFIMESILRKAGVHLTSFQKSVLRTLTTLRS